MVLSLKRKPRFEPRKPRMATFIDTVALLPDDREIPVQMRNISSEGFMGVTVEELPTDTSFGISIPARGIVRAQVRWSDDVTFGARFDLPLRLRDVDSL